MKLNPNQKLAINSEGTNILVFASAGAGKTTIMVQRLLKRIISDGLSLDEMVAMTFTNAASANLKNRLSAAIDKELKKDPSNLHLQRERAKVFDAHISTIHSFCLSLLKEYYYVLGLSFKSVNNLIDDTHAQIAIDELLDDIITRKLTQDAASFNATYDALSSTVADLKMFKDEIKRLFAKLQNEIDPLSFLDREKDKKELFDLKDLDPKESSYYLKVLKMKLGLVIKDLEMMNGCEIEKEALTPKIKELEKILEIDDYAMFLNELRISLKAPKSHSKDELYTKYRKSFEEHAKSLAKDLFEVRSIINDQNEALVHTNYLAAILKELYISYNEYKRSHDYLDFSDIEHLTYELLNKNDQKIAKELKGRFKEIMIDEFQDTSPLQYAIAEMIANDNLFLVGDVKQSIYRFRGASPKIMEGLKSDPSFKKIHLQNNYRSKENVVTFNNQLFDTVMNLGYKAFDENDKQIIGLDKQKCDLKDVTFAYYEIQDDDELSANEIKARLLADEIIRRYQNGTSFKDMAVLVRSHNDKKPIKRVFEELNIPYFINDNEGYFKSFAIETLLAYLNYLLDEDDLISLVAILRSLYHLSENDLVLKKGQLKSFAQESFFKKDYDILKTHFKKNNFEDFFAYFLGVDNFYERLNIAEKTNLDLLINKLKSYHLNTFSELRNFIIEAMESQKETALSISEDANVVRVMTIHNSKGLEFDTVFLFSNVKTKPQSPSRLVYDHDFGLGVRFISGDKRRVKTTLKYKLITLKDKYEDALEYQRLFYVALTRAIKDLVIIDAFKGTTKPLNSGILYENAGFTTYLLGTKDLDLTTKLYEKIPAIKPLSDRIFDEDQNFFSFNYEVNDAPVISPSSQKKHELKLNFNFKKATQYGTKLHEVMEKVDLNTKDLSSFVLNESESEALKAIFDDEIFKRALKGEVKREYSFYIKNDDGIIHGYIDFISFLENEVIIIDYKSDHLEREEDFVTSYEGQLKMYADIIRQSGYSSIHTYIYSFYLKKMIAIAV